MSGDLRQSQLETLRLVQKHGDVGPWIVSETFEIGQRGALKRLRSLVTSGHLVEPEPWSFRLTDLGRAALPSRRQGEGE